MKIYTLSYGEACEGSSIDSVFASLEAAKETLFAEYPNVKLEDYSHNFEWFAWLDAVQVDFALIQEWEINQFPKSK